MAGSDMSEGRWTKLSLRVTSERLTADEIVTALGDAPASKADRGEQISRRSPQAGVHKSSWCIYDCPLASHDTPEKHLDWLTGFVRQHEREFESLKDDCEVDARLSFSSSSGQGAFALDGSVMSLLGRFGIQLHVDLYPQA